MSRHRYPVEICRVFERTATTKLQAALTSPKESESNEAVKASEGGNKVSDAPREKQGNRKGVKSSEPSKNTNDGARAKQATLKAVLGEALGYGPALSEHIILDAGLIPNTKVTKDSKFDIDTIQRLAQSVTKFENWLKDIYDEFCPILLNQFKSREFVKFETFDAALDEFYSKIEGQRPEQQQKAKELLACNYVIVTWAASNENLANASVVVWACYGHSLFTCPKENRVHTLKKEADRCIKMAELIEYNLEDVDAAILAVRVALANGMNWEDLARMVEVDLALSAHANARRWYEQKKRQENKQEKTIIAHEKAFKAAEKKSCVQLSQNKMIVKRYMSKGDLYIHADLHGASSTVIENHKPEHPPGVGFKDCHKCLWVYPHQVSKTASTGEYLTVGSFMIRGKNFLPPHPLMMGFGLLFCLDESSLGSHLNDRRVRGEEEGAQDFEENESLKGNSDSESEKEETDEKRTAESKSIMDPSTHQPILEGFSEISSAHNELTTSNVGSINLPEVPLEERNMLNGNDSEHIDDISGIHVSSVNPQLEDFIDRALELGSNTASGKKYALETSQVDLEEHNHEDRKAKVREKPYTSYQSQRKK
ncbi:Nuclear export mediator factor Nemf [Vitis vinifera]|uniref:Nuclear export mediator factor Nemf n=2 Tax=Vitis vinifera TaxID=29760 RepID=A0A438FXM1_VITVI|nr:Nuclear export mediator factor Nemf [Vitis vinifera]